MKKIIILFLAFSIVLACSLWVHAELYVRGTDSLGYQLIYDSVLNITWYDYTQYKNDWDVQMNWASALTVNFGGNVYNDWRLPIEMYGQDCWGLHCTNSEMGHLYYLTLNNVAYASPVITGPFENLGLYPEGYWSGTERGSADPNAAYYFLFENGGWRAYNKGIDIYAMAVRSGDVYIVPEPISSILFITGGTLLAGRRAIRKKLK